jgi:hypothetical protein
VRRGIVDAVGVGVNEQEVWLELMPRFDLDCILLAGRYTLLEQYDSIDVMAEAQRRGVRIIAADGRDKLKGLRPMIQDIADASWVARPSLDGAVPRFRQSVCGGP